LSERFALEIHIQAGNDHADAAAGKLVTHIGQLFIKKLSLVNSHDIHILRQQ
jgi:hypothetical protein